MVNALISKVLDPRKYTFFPLGPLSEPSSFTLFSFFLRTKRLNYGKGVQTGGNRGDTEKRKTRVRRPVSSGSPPVMHFITRTVGGRSAVSRSHSTR